MQYLDLIKWVATAILIVGSFVNATGWQYGPHVLIFGGLWWLAASVIMKDKQLIVTNLVMIVAGIAGLIFAPIIF